MNQQTDEMPNLYVSTKVNPNGNSNKENYNNPKKKKKIFIQYLYRDFEIRKMKKSFFFCWRFVSLNLDFLQTTGETEIEREARRV